MKTHSGYGGNMKTRDEVYAEQDHRTMILTPDYWPQYPFLPVKRGNALDERNMGVIWAGKLTTV
jgi:hypothetical protein